MPRTYLAIALLWSAVSPVSAATIVDPADSPLSDGQARTDLALDAAQAPIDFEGGTVRESHRPNPPLQDVLLPPGLAAPPRPGSSLAGSTAPADALADRLAPEASIWGTLMMALGTLGAVVWRRRARTAPQLSRSGGRSRTRSGRRRR